MAAEGFLSANRDRPLCQEADVTKGLLHLMAAVDAVEGESNRDNGRASRGSGGLRSRCGGVNSVGCVFAAFDVQGVDGPIQPHSFSLIK